VLVANHLGALGPIAAAACVPRRLHPWVVAAMVDRGDAPEYLRVDFVEKEMGLRMPVSRWVAKALSIVTVPLLRSVGCVPVYAEAECLQLTFQRSVDLLLGGAFVLVFPEDPKLPVDEHTRMSPFRKGFVRLGEMYYERSGKSLRFYPLVVHAASRRVEVCQPISYNPHKAPLDERRRIKNVLQGIIAARYRELEGQPQAGITLPQ
jgi:hypothetical protein